MCVWLVPADVAKALPADLLRITPELPKPSFSAMCNKSKTHYHPPFDSVTMADPFLHDSSFQPPNPPSYAHGNKSLETRNSIYKVVELSRCLK